MRRLVAISLSAVVWLAASPARAQPGGADQARLLFDYARELMDKGEYVAAARAFEGAYQMDPQPLTLANAGEAWEKAGRPADAANALDAALGDPRLSEEARAEATAHRDRLAADLGRVRASGGVTFRVGDSRDRQAGLLLFVAPGAHTLHCRDAEGEHARQIRVSAGETIEVSCARPKQTPTPAPLPAPPPPVVDDGVSPLWIAGWVSLGIAGAAGAAGIGLGAAFVSQRDDYEAGALRTRGDHDDLVTLRTATNVAIFSSAALAIVGTTLLIIDAVDDGGDVAAGGCGALCWRF